MLPTTSFSKLDYLNWPATTTNQWQMKKNRTVQAKPYDLRLPYFVQESTAYRVSGHIPGTLSASLIANSYGENSWAAIWAQGKAWDRFVESATGPTASLGETLAEMRSSGAMVLSRILQFGTFVRALKQLRWREAADALRIPRKRARDVWSRDRTVAQNVMEVQYGWRPLIRDMYNAMSVLQRDFKDVEARGKGSDYQRYFDAGPAFSPSIDILWFARVQYAASIRVSNPNLALMSSLGLTNPLGTLAALVPYSFVLDWFTNFSQALEGYNRFMGLTVYNPATSTRTRVHYTNVWNNYGYHHRCDVETFRRETVLKVPQFHIKPLRGWSPERALNAISLLVQQLPKRPEDRVTVARHNTNLMDWDTGRKLPGFKGRLK